MSDVEGMHSANDDRGDNAEIFPANDDHRNENMVQLQRELQASRHHAEVLQQQMHAQQQQLHAQQQQLQQHHQYQQQQMLPNFNGAPGNAPDSTTLIVNSVNNAAQTQQNLLKDVAGRVNNGNLRLETVINTANNLVSQQTNLAAAVTAANNAATTANINAQRDLTQARDGLYERIDTLNQMVTGHTDLLMQIMATLGVEAPPTHDQQQQMEEVIGQGYCGKCFRDSGYNQRVIHGMLPCTHGSGGKRPAPGNHYDGPKYGRGGRGGYNGGRGGGRFSH